MGDFQQKPLSINGTSPAKSPWIDLRFVYLLVFVGIVFKSDAGFSLPTRAFVTLFGEYLGSVSFPPLRCLEENLLG